MQSGAGGGPCVWKGDIKRDVCLGVWSTVLRFPSHADLPVQVPNHTDWIHLDKGRENGCSAVGSQTALGCDLYCIQIASFHLHSTSVVEGVYRCDIKHDSFLGNRKDEKVLGDKFNRQGRTELCRLAIEITHLKNEWNKPLYSRNNGQGGWYTIHSSTDFVQLT